MLTKLVFKNSAFVLDESESSNSNIKPTAKSSSSSSSTIAALVNNSTMMLKFIPLTMYVLTGHVYILLREEISLSMDPCPSFA